MNWIAIVREAMRKRLDREGETDVVEAVLMNEGLKRKAPGGWDSVKVLIVLVLLFQRLLFRKSLETSIHLLLQPARIRMRKTRSLFISTI